NSFSVDFLIRKKVTNHLSFFILENTPIPRFQSPADHPYFQPLVEKAAALVSTTSAYDELLQEVFGKAANHKTHGVVDPENRQKLKNEIDAMVAKIYELTQDELEYSLSTFPLVADSIKEGVMGEFRGLG
ncbi:MAG: restriction endonuclease subunit M, partial [Spirochaetia bacterium]|nr:restriction endonuclease subunit M [Spirochaetia bacterium]